MELKTNARLKVQYCQIIHLNFKVVEKLNFQPLEVVSHDAIHNFKLVEITDILFNLRQIFVYLDL